jgi:hypothetical protein
MNAAVIKQALYLGLEYEQWILYSQISIIYKIFYFIRELQNFFWIMKMF